MHPLQSSDIGYMELTITSLNIMIKKNTASILIQNIVLYGNFTYINFQTKESPNSKQLSVQKKLLPVGIEPTNRDAEPNSQTAAPNGLIR